MSISLCGSRTLPTYALTATQDLWVARFSSQLGLPRQNRKVARGSHGSIVKPRSRESDGYRWLIETLMSAIETSQRADSGTIKIDRADILAKLKEGPEGPAKVSSIDLQDGTVKYRATDGDSMGQTNQFSAVMSHASDLATEPVPPSGTAVLFVRYGPGRGSRYWLSDEVSAAGRNPDCAIFLDDETVSRQHAEFRRKNGDFTVVDLGSLNGTYVNREQINAEVTLKAGDEVQIGKHRFVFLAPVGNP
jgi:hypothetical protein